MPTPLPDDIKKRAEKKCRDYSNIEVVDPGTMIRADGKMLVLVLDKITHSPLWLEI